MKLPMHVDANVEPGTVEVRDGEKVVGRIVNVTIRADTSGLELAFARIELEMTYARLRFRRARWAFEDFAEVMNR